MIRLTELERSDRQVELKLEGYITSAGLDLLNETFTKYSRENIAILLLDVDGLQSINFHALQTLKAIMPASIQVRFNTTRPYLNTLLTNDHGQAPHGGPKE